MSVAPRDLHRTLAARIRHAREQAEARRRTAVGRARELCGELVRSGAISEAWLVGSAAWGGFGERSDLDVVVRGLPSELTTPTSDRLAAAAELPIDLLRWEDLGGSFRARVCRDGEKLA